MTLDEWKAIQIWYRSPGSEGALLVARPALVVHLAWLRDSPREELVRWFRAQTPAGTAFTQMRSRSTSMGKFAGWGKAEALARDGQYLRIEGEDGYALEFDSEAAALALPPEVIAAAAFDELVGAVRPAHAACAYGFDLVWGRQWEQLALPVLLQIAMRCPAIDLHARNAVSGGGVKGAAWLLHLGQFLAERVAEGCERRSVGAGITFQSDAAPTLDATPGFRALDAQVRPLRMTRWGMPDSLFRCTTPPATVIGFAPSDERPDPDAWFSRLDAA